MKRPFKLLLSLAVTLAFTWWAFRDTRWSQQWVSLRTANYLWMVPYFAMLGAIHVCRTLRWGSLLSGMERLRFRPLNDASAIGFMMLLVLPFRLGEFARPFLIAQRSTIRRSAAMTSVVLERITDGVFIAVLLRALLFFVPNQAPEVRYVRWGGNVMFAIFFGGLLFLIAAAWQHDRVLGLVRRVVGLVSPAAADRAVEVVDAFVGALRQLPPRGQMVAFFGWTALYWALNGFGMWILVHAFACARAGCVPLQIGLFDSYVVMCVLVVGLMIPAAPGMVGTFQAAVKVGLSLFIPAAVVNGTGLAFANVLWLCQTSQQLLLGLLFLSLDQVSFRDLARRLDRTTERSVTPTG